MAARVGMLTGGNPSFQTWLRPNGRGLSFKLPCWARGYYGFARGLVKTNGAIQNHGGGSVGRGGPADLHDRIEPGEGLDLTAPLRRIGQ
jgi:hypothetical protein